VFPELFDESGFAEVGATLDAIEALPVRIVIPGHGAPFTDVIGALARARSRLAAFKADPARHARHAVKVLIKYHVMEERRVAFDALCEWAASAPIVRPNWERVGRHEADSAASWAAQLVQQLVGSGALALEDGVVVDR
jgi:hypothetical protein